MCNVLADGGAAYIMTTRENAEKVCDKPVYILGHGSDFSHRQITRSKQQNLDKLSDYLAPIANKAYERSGLGPEDMDLFEIYASYPGISLMIMDALGVCQSGESGKLFEQGETHPGGKYQASTNGEAMGFGHLGAGCGMSVIIDGVLQLQGRAGEAQASGNPRFLIKNCGGGAFMDAHFTIMGNENIS
jgi:acetyl-CoA C-acetyltransferase